MMNGSTSPAEQLAGRQLEGGWTIRDKLGSTPDLTGGNFSVSYLAEDPKGNRGFVKALDLSRALEPGRDTTRVLQLLTEAFNFERDLLRQCDDRRLNRVVSVLDDGEVFEQGWSVPVPYLVLEHAEKGDIRRFLASMQTFDLAFALRALHNIAVGLQQLHSIGVAHQDLKPSNVVVFDEQTGSKLTDLGQASTKNRVGVWDNQTVAGDPGYCPPEQAYGYASSRWGRRREATDLYHLGSMLMFMFTGLPMSQALWSKLNRAHLPGVWTGGHKAVLPYLLDAFDQVVVDFRAEVPKEMADRLCDLLRYLSTPDLSARGHPTNRIGVESNFGLQRFISAFDLLARSAELRLTR